MNTKDSVCSLVIFFSNELNTFLLYNSLKTKTKGLLVCLSEFALPIYLRLSNLENQD